MATIACAVCKQDFDEHDLLVDARGRICSACELELEERSTLLRGVWFTVVNGPITAAAATVMACVPFIGPALMLVMGAMALWRGTVALQVAWYGRDDDALGSGQRAALWISGGLTTLWATGVVMAGGVFGVLTLFAWQSGGAW